MQRSRVDLPEPLGPITQTTSPRLTSRPTPRSTSSLPKRLCTPSSCSIGPLVPALGSISGASLMRHTPAIPVAGGPEGSAESSSELPLRLTRRCWRAIR